MLVLETAKPEKFPDIVFEATGVQLGIPEQLAGLLERAQRVTEMADDADELRAFISAHAVHR